MVFKHYIHLLATLALVCSASAAGTAYAQTMSSGGYKVDGDFIEFGGTASGTGFQINSTGDSGAEGMGSSASYNLTGGFVLASTLDTDLDTIPDTIENNAQNGGDGNGDGVPDRLQAHVATAFNTSTNLPVTVQFTGGCPLVLGLASKPLSAYGISDPNYSYPLGMIDFDVDCSGNIGTTTQVTVFYDSVQSTGSWIYRKYKGGQFYTVNALATAVPANAISSTYTYTVGPSTGAQVTKVQYSIQDGDLADNDATANARIKDPFGPAIYTPAPTPSTGGGGGVIPNLISGVYNFLGLGAGINGTSTSVKDVTKLFTQNLGKNEVGTSTTIVTPEEGGFVDVVAGAVKNVVKALTGSGDTLGTLAQNGTMHPMQFVWYVDALQGEFGPIVWFFSLIGLFCLFILTYYALWWLMRIFKRIQRIQKPDHSIVTTVVQPAPMIGGVHTGVFPTGKDAATAAPQKPPTADFIEEDIQ
jgi:hypothetical protein